MDFIQKEPRAVTSVVSEFRIHKQVERKSGKSQVVADHLTIGEGWASLSLARKLAGVRCVVLLLFMVQMTGCSESEIDLNTNKIRQAQLEELKRQNELLQAQADQQAAKDEAMKERQDRLASIDESAEYAATHVNEYLMELQRTTNRANREFREITQGEVTIGQIGQDAGASYHTQLFNEIKALLIKTTMHIKDRQQFEDAVTKETISWMQSKS